MVEQSHPQLILVENMKVFWFLASFTFFGGASQQASCAKLMRNSKQENVERPKHLGVFSPIFVVIFLLQILTSVTFTIYLKFSAQKPLMLFVLICHKVYSYWLDTTGHLGCPYVCVASERVGGLWDEKKEEEAKWRGGHTAFCFHLRDMVSSDNEREGKWECERRRKGEEAT